LHVVNLLSVEPLRHAYRERVPAAAAAAVAVAAAERADLEVPSRAGGGDEADKNRCQMSNEKREFCGGRGLTVRRSTMGCIAMNQ
jgi:hypothetical protein